MYKREEEVKRIKLENRRRISKNFKFLRLSLGMTQDEFAKAITTSKSYISRIENESRSAGDDILARVEDYFGKPRSYFDSRKEAELVKRGLKIVTTDRGLMEIFKPGMILHVSKKDMKKKGSFITEWDFEGASTMIEYKSWMPIEYDPDASLKATCQIKVVSLKM